MRDLAATVNQMLTDIGNVQSDYAKLGGVTGGQTLCGDTAIDGELTLQGTSDASKGQVVVDADLECTGLPNFELPNFDPGQFGNDFSGCFSNHGLFAGWNRTAGIGETDFVNVRSGGITGGFQFYEYNPTSHNIDPIFIIYGWGGIYVPGTYTQKIGTNADSTGQPAGDWASIIYHAVNSSGKNGLLVKNNYQAAGSTIFETGVDFVGGAYMPAFKVTGDLNVWMASDCSALTFTDRTEAFVGDALEAVKTISSDVDGNIDHDTLPKFVQSTYRDEEGVERPGRNIGNMVSILTTAVQQLHATLSEKEGTIERLEQRVILLEQSLLSAK